MSTVTAVEHQKSARILIPSNTLLEELYTYYSLFQLQAMLKCEPDEDLLKYWGITAKRLQEELLLAKRDCHWLFTNQNQQVGISKRTEYKNKCTAG